MPDQRARRIVSLVPSATETVFRLGAGDHLVGRSHVCLYPTEATALPALTQVKLGAESSRGIHDEVRARLSEGLALYDVDLDRLRQLEPTHLLVQDQCSVCAVSPADLETALREWFGKAPEVVALAPHQLIDVWADIERVGNAVGRAAEARQLCADLAGRLSDLVESSVPSAPRPRVACVEWLEPLMIAGHWVPELVRLAGGEPVLAETGGASTTVDVKTLAQAQPDVLIIQICGFDLAASRRAWTQAEGLRAELARAFGDGRPAIPIFLTDGDAYFNRPGPRLVDSAEIVAALLNEVSGSLPVGRSDAIRLQL